ncbi:MAG TPA: cytochrome P450, partial [Ktedonobacteraceae bacterium]|nr:cytochrome P450 [Ktedonobacteraceae bacterium]
HGAAMETLRLYPISLGHSCRALQPFIFAGYRVEPGADVFVAMTVSHFLPELFHQPEVFDVDRYSSPRNEHRQPGAYAPFGLGDHTCLGAGIAETQLMSTIATLLFLYQLALDAPDHTIHPLEAMHSLTREQFRIRVVACRQPEEE